MRLTSIVLVLALTCIPAQSQDPVKQLRGAKEPESKATAAELPDANSETETAAELPANAPANVPAAPNPPANPDDIGVPEKEAETQTVESPASEQGETADPAEANDIGVPTKETPAKQDGKGHATRVPPEEDGEEPLDGEWEWSDVSSMRGGAPWDWGWGDVDEMRGPVPWVVPYAYTMRTGPHPWEDGWDDDGYQPQAIDALSGPFDARSFVAWRRGRGGGRRWGRRGGGRRGRGRRGGRGWWR